LKLFGKGAKWKNVVRAQQIVGGPHAQLDLYGMVSMSRRLFYHPSLWDQIGDHLPYQDLPINLERVKRWHPLNQSLYLGYKILLPGLLMNHKGDRPAMHHSLETRYPFLDEEVIDYCARIHPRYKLKGIRRDKHLLRLFARTILPESISERPKAMFRAPFANSFFDNPPSWAEQLLSEESLVRSGYFSVDGVTQARQTYHSKKNGSYSRLSIEMGLTAVMSTQLWHHLYLGGGLCDLPVYKAPEPTATEFPSPLVGTEKAFS
jgi:asparagine synthase (glutamine-hydrolysing)